MCPNLLIDDDRIKVLDAPQRLEIQDYINMRYLKVSTVVKWQRIRSMCITDHGVTLWQMSERYLNSLNARAIGSLESPVHLFEWILKESPKKLGSLV